MAFSRWRRFTQLFDCSARNLVFVAGCIGIILAVWSGLGKYISVPVAVPVSSGIPMGFPRWHDVLSAGIPGLSAVTEPKKQPVIITRDFSWRYLLRESIRFFTYVDIMDARTLLRVEIAVLTPPGSSAHGVISRPSIQFKPKTTVPVTKPLVAIYHTHTSESFLPSSGVTHKKGGQQGEIVEVGDAFSQRLNQYGVRTIHSKAIHDYPSFMKAYGPSELTVKKMLVDYPSIQMVFDIHRDAEKRENCITDIKGVSVARIAIIVASGQEDLPQPNWKKNLEFANLINSKLNKYFPGVSRGIQTVEWRYNQHLHPRALLFEIGSQETSKEEAIRCVEILGDVLVEILAENNNFGVHD